MSEELEMPKRHPRKGHPKKNLLEFYLGLLEPPGMLLEIQWNLCILLEFSYPHALWGV